jgi:hypothetical protein
MIRIVIGIRVYSVLIRQFFYTRYRDLKNCSKSGISLVISALIRSRTCFNRFTLVLSRTRRALSGGIIRFLQLDQSPEKPQIQVISGGNLGILRCKHHIPYFKNSRDSRCSLRIRAVSWDSRYFLRISSILRDSKISTRDY